MEVKRGKLNQREYGEDLTERPRATTQAALAPERYPSQSLSPIDVDSISASATRSGAASAVVAAVVSGGTVFGLHAISPRFRAALGMSGKLALVVTPTFGAFVLNSHLAIADARADPDGFIAPAREQQQQRAAAAAAAPRQESLGLYHTVANALYQSPFKCILGIAGPLYGAIFYAESVHPTTGNLPLIQRLFHTRVYGQAVAIVTTIGVMGFAESMKKEGAYRLEDGRIVRGERQTTLRHWYSTSDGRPARMPEGALRPPAAGEAGGAAPAAPRQAEPAAAERSPLELMAPLFYVPAIAGLRFGLKGRLPDYRVNQVVMGSIGVGLLHAGTMMFGDSSVV